MEPEFGSAAVVKAALGEIVGSASSTAQINLWLETAEMKIRARFKNLDALIAAGKVDSKTVAKVANLAAERAARNPDGWRQFGIDNGQGTRDTALSDGQVKIRDDEWDLIYMPVAVPIQGAYSVRLGTPC